MQSLEVIITPSPMDKMATLSSPLLLSLCLAGTLIHMAYAANYTLTMESETSCSKTHYYKPGDKFTASAKGGVFGGMCPLTFIQTGSLHGDPYVEPCVSMCIHIVSYTMDGCNVQMAYYDGLTDYSPVKFDCHTFPPMMWCTSKNELKITVTELERYNKEKYTITVNVTPFCDREDRFTTDSSVVAQPHVKKTSISQTALIIGAIVGTVSILFVLAWFIYCIRKRHLELTAEQADRPADRAARGGTPCQPVNRYAPIENRNQTSSQSSSDRGIVAKQPPDYGGNQNINNLGERRLYSPFQPPTQRAPGAQQPQQQVLFSDLDRGPPGDKWYPGGNPEKNLRNIDPYPPGSRFGPATTQNQPQSQYMLQNQVYKYPQFSNTDGEMHTHPTDTRFVVYDFDFEQPVERKYSAGKIRTTPLRDSPSNELDRQRPREITPLRETVRIMPPIDGGNTDQTSENESSFSGTTEDDTETDDAMPRCALGPPLAFFNQQRDDPVTQTVYDYRNFQRVITKTPNKSDDQLKINQAVPGVSETITNNTSPDSPKISPGLGADQANTVEKDEKEGPVPQVPPMPKNFNRSQMSSPTQDLQWPHGPPPPYSPITTDKFSV